MPSRKIPTAPVTPAPAGLPLGADPEAWQQLQTLPPVSHAQLTTHAQTLEDEDEDEEISAAERVRAVMGSNAADGARVSIYRRDPRTKSRAFCIDYTPDQFIEGGMSLVQSDLGPGSYEWRMFGRQGSLGRGVFEIAATAKISSNPVQTETAPSSIERVLESIAQNQAMLLQALQNKPDPQAQMMQSLEMLRVMREAMGSPAPAVSASGAPPTLLEQLQTLRELKKFMNEEKEDGSGADPENPLSMLGPLLDVVKTSMQARTVETLPMVSAPASLQGPKAAPAQSAEPEDDEAAMRAIITTLVDMAAAGQTPEQGGDFLWRYLPDSAISFVRQPAVVSTLCTMQPMLKPHTDWLEKARLVCVRLLNENKPAGQ